MLSNAGTKVRSKATSLSVDEYGSLLGSHGPWDLFMRPNLDTRGNVTDEKGHFLTSISIHSTSLPTHHHAGACITTGTGSLPKDPRLRNKSYAPPP